MILNTKIYPRSNDYQTVYLNAVVRNPAIVVGDYTIYNDFVNDPTQFEKNNVLYHYPVNGDRLVIGKFCSIACGAKFLFNSANHTLNSLSNYPFPIFFEEWQLDKKDVASAWDMMSGLDMKLLSWQVYMLGTEQSLRHGRLLQKMFLLIR